jgi:hypothetical protein|uniref:C2H2-type domain-containing protein n=1 Tax=viral metagenome TaxID=1070528 RepID=A0A6C0AMB1_9ZZZZ
MSLDNFNSDLEKILTDSSIFSYFVSTNKSIYEFIKIYIEVDKVLGDTNINSNLVSIKLDEIKSSLLNHTQQISSLSTNINNTNTNIISILQNKLDNIKDITNKELQIIFSDLQKIMIENNDQKELKNIFDNFKDRIEILNNQKLNDIDKKNLEILSHIQSTFEKSLDSHNITNKIFSIESTLSNINENFSNNSSKKGQVAETILFNILTENFQDTEVIDTSHIPNSGDIQLIKDNKPTILIDSKNFGSKTVPKRDLDKFYNDIQQNNCSGILCNAFGGIANKQNFEIDIVDKNIIVFIHSHQFDSNIFKLATNIIYNLQHELKEKQNDTINIDQRLFQNLKIEYNYYIQSFRHHLDIIKSNVNSLSQLSFTLLDNFFKRKTINNVELKQFSCHICSTQLSTEKILKNHIKRIHPNYTPNENLPLITIDSKPKGRPKGKTTKINTDNTNNTNTDNTNTVNINTNNINLNDNISEKSNSNSNSEKSSEN